MIMSEKTSLHLIGSDDFVVCVADESVVRVHFDHCFDVVEDKVIWIIEGAVPRTVGLKGEGNSRHDLAQIPRELRSVKQPDDISLEAHK